MEKGLYCVILIFQLYSLLHPLGIPIDHIGGTSMGAFIGAIYAEHGDIVKTTQRAREGCLVSLNNLPFLLTL